MDIREAMFTETEMSKGPKSIIVREQQDKDSAGVLLTTHLGTVYNIQFPATMTTQELVSALVLEFGFPSTSLNDDRIVYGLEAVHDGGMYTFSKEEHPGEFIGKFKNSELNLTLEMTARSKS